MTSFDGREEKEEEGEERERLINVRQRVRPSDFRAIAIRYHVFLTCFSDSSASFEGGKPVQRERQDEKKNSHDAIPKIKLGQGSDGTEHEAAF